MFSFHGLTSRGTLGVPLLPQYSRRNQVTPTLPEADYSFPAGRRQIRGRLQLFTPRADSALNTRTKDTVSSGVSGAMPRFTPGCPFTALGGSVSLWKTR